MVPDQQLRDAVYGAQNAALPDASLGAGQPEVDRAYTTRFQAPVIHAASNALVNQSQMNLDEQKKQAAAAEQRAKDLADPKNYQKIPRSDGGFGFYDPSGKEISAHDYALIVGTTVDKVLADSQNPIDLSFREDYNNLRDYMTAVQNNDKKAIDAIQNANPSLKDIKDPHELMNKFMQAYPTVFNRGGFNGAGSAGQPVGSSYIPNAKAQESNNSYSGGGGGGIGF